jgi:hypothetical protein
LTVGEWAWKYHPHIFQFSKAYVRLLSLSTPNRETPGAAGQDDEDDDGENSADEDEEKTEDMEEDDA